MERILIKRLLYVVIGSIILAFGISIAVKSTFGADALSVLYDGISNSFSISFGTASLIVNIAFLIPVLMFGMKHIGIGTICAPVIISLITDLIFKTEFLIENSIINFLFVVIGIVCIGIGSGIYVSANLGKSTYDGFIFIVSEFFNKPFGITRTVSDVLIFIFGIMLGGLFGIGALLSVLFVGSIMQITMEKMVIIIDKK